MPHNFVSLKHDYYHRAPVELTPPPKGEPLYSDIVLHLPVLEWYASLCNHVTEFGVRDCHSTVALISGCKGEVHSYDLKPSPTVASLYQMSLPCLWFFATANTIEDTFSIPETDLIFFDTLHTYTHLSKELAKHGRQASKYLAFHDTFSCAHFDVSGNDPREPGILPAIEHFLSAFPGEYGTVYRTDANNGLWILERK